MSHLVVRVGTPWRMPVVLAVVAEPATIPVGVTAVCEGCGGNISATNCTDTPSHCYWCSHPEMALRLGIDRRTVVVA
jgi:hypothetical protein